MTTLTAPLKLYDSALQALLLQEHAPLSDIPLSALLLASQYQPNPVGHATLADALSFEVTGGDYNRQQMTGAMLSRVSGGVMFTSDPLHWGDPVTMPLAGFLLLCRGRLGDLVPSSPLFGVMALTADGTPVEALRGAFTLSPPATGWFTLTRAS